MVEANGGVVASSQRHTNWTSVSRMNADGLDTWKAARSSPRSIPLSRRWGRDSESLVPSLAIGQVRGKLPDRGVYQPPRLGSEQARAIERDATSVSRCARSEASAELVRDQSPGSNESLIQTDRGSPSGAHRRFIQEGPPFGRGGAGRCRVNR